MNDMPTLKHHWKIQFTYPKAHPASGNEYNTTGFVGVVASTIEEAIAAVRKANPRATVYTASHQGQIKIDATAGIATIDAETA